jgi:DNA helicase-2/ATP-dependent DNA helicase PcrA
MAFVPSTYQQAVFDAALHTTDHLQVEAVAGSGKTKTIEELAKRLPDHLARKTLLCAFNKHIQTELERRQKAGDIPQAVTVSTIHALGYKILADAVQPKDRRNWIDGSKYRHLSRVWWADNATFVEQGTEVYRLAVDATHTLVELCQATLTNPEDEDALRDLIAHHDVWYPAEWEDRVFDAVAQVLLWGDKGLKYPDPRTGKKFGPEETVSFGDLVYLPVHRKLQGRTFDLVLVDECQDLNRCQQEFLRARLNGAGRAIFVGDRAQAIYGFAGADAEAFERVGQDCVKLPLSICYRCSKAVVERAQQYVSQIEAAPDAPEGAVLQVSEDQLLELAREHQRSGRLRREPLLLLCRCNAPLFAAAFALLKTGVPAQIVGRDIASGLLKLVDAIAELLDFKEEEFPEFAEVYLRQQVDTLSRRANTELQIANLQDRVESLLCIWQHLASTGKAASLAELRASLTELFADKDNAVQLSSIHKAKGLEAHTVGLLHPELLPHPRAKQAWELVQERNLAYVATTRARHTLLIASGEPKPAEPPASDPPASVAVEVVEEAEEPAAVSQPDPLLEYLGTAYGLALSRVASAQWDDDRVYWQGQVDALRGVLEHLQR